ncbi:MAG: PhnD/SsuA/transferrin family substrate-binding protein [Xanthobacteraceae bacterium]|nr:PhnD/SsuA/transferrin family substrate-binding protein [Xanthobacteraceae bacterium]
MSLVSNARMYAVTPNVHAAWQTLFAWVSRASGVPLAYVDHAAPAPLEALWARNDLGAAFMCGFPFALATPRPHLIAAPVPSAPRYGGLPQYCTDFVVRADHPATQLSDTFGGRLGWTVEHSQSGFNAVRHHVGRYKPERNGPLYAQWVGPLLTPRRVIDAVIAGKIDVGPLDSYVHDLLLRHEPATAARLRVVESTAMTPIPPLIASHTLDEGSVERLRQALISGANESELVLTFESLCLAGFVSVDADDYQKLVTQARNAENNDLSIFLDRG